MTSILKRLLAEPAPLGSIESRPAHKWFVVGLVCIGAMVGQLDATIVQLALPALARQFDMQPQQVSWVALSYLIAFAAFLPIFGRLCDMVGRKNLYIVGYLIFVLGSALCALAPSFEALIAFRFLQGIGGSLLGANSISILVKAIPPAERGRALGYFAAAQAVGMSAGPVLGGLILTELGWRWIFWVTVPFGALAIIAGWLILPRTAGAGGDRKFDWGGALLIGPALGLLVAVLNHVAGRSSSLPLTLGGAVLAGLLLLLLVRRESASPAPLIDPRLFRSARFCAGSLAVLLAYGLLCCMFFLLSFALVHGYGDSPAAAGLRLGIIPVAIGIAAPLSNAVRNRLGDNGIGAAGMLSCCAATVLLMLSLGDGGDARVLDGLAFALFGAGLGIFVAPNNNATIAAAPAELAGAAGSLLNLMRVLGTSLGVAAGAAMLAASLGDSGWQQVEPARLLDAVRDSLPVLAAMAILAFVAARIVARRPAI